MSAPGCAMEDTSGALVVRVERGQEQPAEHTFTRSPIRIGRSPRNDLALPLQFVSAWHAVVEFTAREVRYTDLGSANGSFVNGRRLKPRAPGLLGEGARVAIGSITLTFTRRAREAPLHEPPVEPTGDEAPVKKGRLTELLQELAGGPGGDAEADWRDVLFPGVKVDRFELLREIGRGAFGVVYEAKDTRLGRHVAFKAVRPGRHSRVLLRQERLQKEAEAVAQLHHPNIVTIYDAGMCPHGPFLILELLQGTTLDARMREGLLPLSQTLEIGIGVARALAHAHLQGVIHRDLKPANIFLCKDGRAKVLDFGIAGVFGAGDPDVLGTPAYMPPEQWRGEPQDARADVFAAAVILCEMVTGSLPYEVTPEHSTAMDPGARPKVDAPKAPGDLALLLRRALSPSPEERPRDGQAWLDALEGIARELSGQSP